MTLKELGYTKIDGCWVQTIGDNQFQIRFGLGLKGDTTVQFSYFDVLMGIRRPWYADKETLKAVLEEMED